jgi:hypothetical protein
VNEMARKRVWLSVNPIVTHFSSGLDNIHKVK